jgi:hypothetical protein
MSKREPTSRPLTVRQQFWLEHLQAWEASGNSLREYAREHGLSISGLYSARRWFKVNAQRPRPDAVPVRPTTPTLVPVRLRAPLAPSNTPAMRVCLPTGVVVELNEHCVPERGAALVRALMDRHA